MIQEFVDNFMKREQELKCWIKECSDINYKTLVEMTIKAISKEDDYGYPDHNRVHELDDGDYQGTLVYVIAANGYQPNDYWYVKIYYGSCSGCDTIEAIRDYSDEMTEQKVNDYFTLCLHIVQGLKKMGEDSV